MHPLEAWLKVGLSLLVSHPANPNSPQTLKISLGKFGNQPVLLELCLNGVIIHFNV